MSCPLEYRANIADYLREFGCPESEVERQIDAAWDLHAAVATFLNEQDGGQSLKLMTLVAIMKQILRAKGDPEAVALVIKHAANALGVKVVTEVEEAREAPGPVRGRPARAPPAPGDPSPTRGRRWRS